jgi:MFS family permease
MEIIKAFPKGIHANLAQFSHQLLQVMFVGLILGTMRTVIPALASTEFGLPKDSYVLLTTFVVAFGLVKALLNFISGRLSEKIGRKKVLIIGWLFAIPIPFLVFFGLSWGYIVFATVLLGINQGFCWSMTQTSKLDFIHQNERGLAIGMNEAAGYFGLAMAGIITAYLATIFGARLSLLIFGMSTILIAICLSCIFVKDTLSWTREPNFAIEPLSNDLIINKYQLTIIQIFMRMSWQDKRLMAICQAGLVEKFVDALIWVFYPVLMIKLGMSLQSIGWVVGVYGFVWGLSQPFTGRLSDRIGRHNLCVWGMWLCGLGVLMMLFKSNMSWYLVSATTSGLGMAMLYPNLSATVADLADKSWRGSAIGIYRFWRDLGYAIGALGIGIVAEISDSIETAFWFVAISMFISGAILWYWGEETLHANN